MLPFWHYDFGVLTNADLSMVEPKHRMYSNLDGLRDELREMQVEP